MNNFPNLNDLPKKLRDYFYITEEFNIYNIDEEEKDSFFCWSNKSEHNCFFPYKIVSSDSAYSSSHFSFGGILTTERGHKLGLIVNDLLIDLRAKRLTTLIVRLPPNIYKSIPHEQLSHLMILSKETNLLGLEIFPVLPLDLKTLSKSKRKYLINDNPDIFWNIEDDLFQGWKILEENLRLKYGVTPYHSAFDIYRLHKQFPGCVEWNVKKLKSQVLGIQVYFLLENVVHNQYTASSPVGKTLDTIDYLTGNAITRYKSTRQFYDFGKSTEKDGSIINFNLLEYKMRWGSIGMQGPILRFKI